MKPNNKFKAVYNPIIRQLAVIYGDVVFEHEFEEYEEWVKITHPDNYKQYLHIQLDYDNHLQLLFYPRIEGDESLHEDMGVYLHYGTQETYPDNISIVFTDAIYELELKRLSNIFI